MPLGTPIQLTLYDNDDAEIMTYSRARIPLALMERAIELQEKLGGEVSKEMLMAIYQLMVDFFGEKFTIDELRAGADLGEMINVVKEIAVRAAELMPASPNLLPPPARQARRR